MLQSFLTLNLQNLMTFLLRRIGRSVCTGSLALPAILSGPAVLFPPGTAASRSPKCIQLDRLSAGKDQLPAVGSYMSASPETNLKLVFSFTESSSQN